MKMIYMILMISSAIAIVFSHSLAKADNPEKDRAKKLNDLTQIFDILRDHTSYGLTSSEFYEALDFEPKSDLTRVRNPFEEAFQVQNPSKDRFSATGATFTYSTGIPDPNAPVYSGKTLPHTFHFGRPETILDFSRDITDRPHKKTLFENSPYFLLDTNYQRHSSYALAPLRMDENLIVFAASMGYQQDPSERVINYKGRMHEPKRVPRRIMLLIGVRTDEIDQVEKSQLTSTDIAQYHLRVGAMTAEELELARLAQLEKMPNISELTRHNSSYMTLKINTERANLNLATRDMRAEVEDLISRAADSVPGFKNQALQMFEDGGVGVMQTRDGRQYLVQSLAIPVIRISHPTAIDGRIPEFVNALLDPKLQLKKKILLPNDLERAKALIEKIKRNKATAEMRAVLLKAQSPTPPPSRGLSEIALECKGLFDR